MIQKENKYILLFFWLMLCIPLLLNGQTKTISLEVSIVDSLDSPISGALILAQEGSKAYYSDNNGLATVEAFKKDYLRIEAQGYITQESVSVPSENTIKIVLTEHEFHSEKIAVPFGEIKRNQTASNIGVVDLEQIRKYDNSMYVGDALHGRIPGLFGTTDLYGMGNALIVVDGVPALDFNLLLQEVEEITVLKDAASSILYGAKGHNGVILIKTKKGNPNKRQINVYAETGMGFYKSTPKYLNSADYMEKYNEALVLDGLDEQYSEDDINKTRSGFDPVLLPDEDLFDDRFLNSYRSEQKVVAEFSGGTQKAQYYSNINYSRMGSEYKLGNGDESFQKINIRGNVDYALNDWLSISMNAVAKFAIDKQVPTNYWEQTANLKPNEYALLIPSSRVYDSLALATGTMIDGNLIGGTNNYKDNVYAQFTSGSYIKGMGQNVTFRTGLDFNFSSITPGLTASCYFNFDIYNAYLVTLDNTTDIYAAFGDSAGVDTITVDKIQVKDRAQEQGGGNLGFARRNSFFGTINYAREFGIHSVDLTLMGYRDQTAVADVRQYNKTLHFGLRANYMYNNKYIVEFNNAFVGSSRLYGSNNRWDNAPSVALGWILSEENFLKNVSIIDHLKIKGSYGISKYDQNIEYYSYASLYAESGWYWYGGDLQLRNARRNQELLDNPDLEFEKRKDLSFGGEINLMKKLWFEANYLKSERYDEVVQLENVFPDFVGDALAYVNYESKEYVGYDFGLQYTDRIGEFEYSFGVNTAHYKSEVLIKDEPNFEEAYMSRVGKPVDAIYGYQADGLYSEDDFDESGNLLPGMPVPSVSEVRPGDIKYIDLNNDSIINVDDISNIGNWHAKMNLSVNINLHYKGFSLFVLGNGRFGSQDIWNHPYYNNDGESKWSEEVLKNWTPETASTATYPRLSATANENNKLTSTFWMQDLNYFSISVIQLSYDLPKTLAGKLFMKNARIYVRGENLLLISNVKEKLETNIGRTPQMRTVKIGLNLNF